MVCAAVRQLQCVPALGSGQVRQNPRVQVLHCSGLETSDFSGNYVLGFRVEKLEEAFTEICQLFTAFAVNPNFGVECSFENLEGPQNTQAITQIED